MTATLVKYASYSSVVLIVLAVLVVLAVWLLAVTFLLMASRGRLDSAQRAIKRLNADVKAVRRIRHEPATTPEMPEPTAALGTLSRLFPPPVPVPLPAAVPAPPEVAWRAEPVVPTNPIRQQPLRGNGRHSTTDRNRAR